MNFECPELGSQMASWEPLKELRVSLVDFMKTGVLTGALKEEEEEHWDEALRGNYGCGEV